MVFSILAFFQLKSSDNLKDIIIIFLLRKARKQTINYRNGTR